MAPQLLVSVRHADEVDLATTAGCRVLDIKNPDRGSLGMATPKTWQAVVDRVARNSTSYAGQQPELSVALGELVDWIANREVPAIPAGVTYAKLGMSGLAELQPDWPQLWQRTRARFDACAAAPLKWVAVTYADWPAMDAPDPQRILNVARHSGCAGVLLDTCNKSAGRLLDCWTPAEIAEWVQDIQRAGLFAAVAGSLSLDDLPALQQVDCDLLGIRGAACAASRRTQRIDEKALSSFVESMHSVWQPVQERD